MQACKFIPTCIVAGNYECLPPFPALYTSHNANKPENINSSNLKHFTVIKVTTTNQEETFSETQFYNTDS